MQARVRHSRQKRAKSEERSGDFVICFCVFMEFKRISDTIGYVADTTSAEKILHDAGGGGGGGRVPLATFQLPSTILDKTVDTNPLYPGQCWFGVACWAHCHPNFPLNMENVCCNIVRGGRGATDTLFHNKVDLFRNFGGKVPFLSMCQQVLSKIVSQSFSIFSWSTDPNGTNS